MKLKKFILSTTYDILLLCLVSYSLSLEFSPILILTIIIFLIITILDGIECFKKND